MINKNCKMAGGMSDGLAKPRVFRSIRAFSHLWVCVVAGMTLAEVVAQRLPFGRKHGMENQYCRSIVLPRCKA